MNQTKPKNKLKGEIKFEKKSNKMWDSVVNKMKKVAGIKHSNFTKLYNQAIYNENGEEICDPRKVVVETGLVRPKTLAEQVKELVAMEQFKAGLNQLELETLEQAEDFGMPDEDILPTTQYEYNAMAEDLEMGESFTVEGENNVKTDTQSNTDGNSSQPVDNDSSGGAPTVAGESS